MHPDLTTLQDLLHYRFSNIDYLKHALVHKSFANEKKDQGIEDNERLEFLGDAVLDLIISESLVEGYPSYSEGRLSKLRALVVNEGSLSTVARSLDLGKHILLGRGEEQSGGRDKDSILADTLEAIIAAIYLDSGLDSTSRFVLPLLEDRIRNVAGSDSPLDFKTELQELSQSLKGILPRYRIVREEGPDHEKVFLVELTLDDSIISTGKGRSKKAAEQDAARKALVKLKKT
ncbi:MAG: ribonuclease III [Nitrospirota bacterium]|nr:ribonuclease III [Nitrospirota bacterium]